MRPMMAATIGPAIKPVHIGSEVFFSIRATLAVAMVTIIMIAIA